MHMVELNSKYQKDPSLVHRNILGESILVPIRQNVGDLDSIYSLNETASFAWEMINGKRSLLEISEMITREFEVDKEQAQKDFLELIVILEKLGAIYKV
jgi:hypothetical protein